MKIFAEIQEARRANRALYDEAIKIPDAATAEKRSMTAEERSKMDSMLKAVEDRGEEIKLAERALGLGDALRSAGEALREEAGNQELGGAKDKEQTRKHAQAFRRFLQVGMAELVPEDRALMQAQFRDLGTGAGNTGGYTVPQSFVHELEKALKYYGPMLNVAKILTTENGAPLPWATLNDTAGVGEIIGENAASTKDTTLTPFGQKTFGAYIYSSKIIPISLALLQDMDFDEAIIADMIADRLGRKLNTDFTVGDGTSKPTGIVPGATLGKTGATGQTGALIYDDLVDLLHSVDPAYRNKPTVGFMAHDLTLAALRKIKDTTGRPLWQPSLQDGQPDMILNKPVYVNNDMATMAASAKSLIFGDLSKYIIRRVRDVQVMRLGERYADQLQVGFIGFVRADGGLINAGTNPVKYYANSAT